MPNTFIQRLLSHLYSDGIIQEQPEHTYRESYGTTKRQGDHALSYVSSEGGNDVHTCLPEGSLLRGRYLLEEEDVFIVFILNNGVSEIGIADYARKEYRKVLDENSEGLDCPLNFKTCTWTNVDVNYVGHCNNVHIYFQTDNVYRVINITDPCCDWTDTKLFRPKCIATAKTIVIDGMGRLQNGKYKVAVRVKDEDGNPTNYSITTQGVSIALGDFRPGEEGKGAISIEVSNLPKEYSLADIVIIEEVDGDKRFKQITNVGYGNGYLRFTYTGVEGSYVEKDQKLTEITTRIKHNYRGEGHDVVDGRLGLFNTEAEINWSLQQYVNDMQVMYRRWAVPISEAGKYNTLMPNENYIFSVGFNFDDGTRTKAFEFINTRVPSGSGTIEVGGSGNCTNCSVPEWMGTDTSFRTKLYIKNAYDLTKAFEEKLKNTPQDAAFDNAITPDIDPFNSGLADQQEPSNPVDPIEGDSDTTASATPGDVAAVEYAKSLCGCGNCEKSFLDNLIVNIAEFFGADGSLYKACICESLDCSIEIAHPAGREDIAEVNSKTKTDSNNIKYIETQIPCNKDGEVRCSGQVCYECKGGTWYFVNNSYRYKKDANYVREYKPKDLGGERDFTNVRGSDTNGFTPNVIGADNECVENITPVLYSEGYFGYWQTDQLYPTMTDRSDFTGDKCRPIYREWAGKNQTCFKVPSQSKEPSYVSLGNGVQNKYDVVNTPDGDTYALLTGLYIKGLNNLPVGFKKRLCPKQPITIYYAPRTEQNKTVIDNSMMIGTFSGLIQNEPALFGKLGVNSLEYYDTNINPGVEGTWRRGYNTGTPAYILHGANLHLWGKREDVDYMLIEQEIYGCGWRFKQYAEGERPASPFDRKLNIGGTTQSIALNKYQLPVGSNGSPIIRCVKGRKWAPADSVVTKDNVFTYSLINLYRESSMYTEIEGEKLRLSNGTKRLVGSLNGGDNADDFSFIGDTIDHESLVGDSRAWNVTSMKYLPNQYGSSINRLYIPIGLNGDDVAIKTGELSGICGDAYVGPFTVKRTAFPSDKVPEEISPSADFGSIRIDLKIPIIGGVLSDILTDISRGVLRVAGYEECGTVPLTGDPDDVRNWLGSLRRDMRAITDKDASGLLPPSTDIEITKQWFYTITLRAPSDAYYPHLLKTLIRTYQVSDANLNYRAAGAVQVGDYKNMNFGVAEVHADKLKSLKLDSAFPSGTDYHLAWLDRFGFWMWENPSWKMVLRMILNIIWVYIPGFFFIYNGIVAIIEGLSKAGSGFLGLTGLAATGALTGFGLALIYLGYYWITEWANTDLDNKVIDSILGIDYCRPDRKSEVTALGSQFMMDQGRAKGFEDNFWSYDASHSILNYEGFIFGIPLNYDTQLCPDRYSSKLIFSDQQVLESHLDSWRNFKPNQFIRIPRDRGQVTRILWMQNQLTVQTTDSMFKIPFRQQRLQLTDEEVILGRGTLFGDPVDLYGGSVEGQGGNKDPNASEVTSRGYLYVDRDARRLKLYTGRNDTDITFRGMEEFMDCNMYFKILEDVPDFDLVDQKCNGGVYFDLALDYAKDMVYIYKRDFSLHEGTKYIGGKFERDGEVVSPGNEDAFKDESFLLSFKLSTNYYVSKHYWRPEVLLYNRFRMFSVKESIIYDHFVKGIFNYHYGELSPILIDIPFINKETYQNWILRNIQVIGEVLQHDGDVITELDIPLFEKFMIFNGRQSSGWLDLRGIGIDSDESLIEDITERDEIKYRQSTNRIVIEEFKNGIQKGVAPLNKYNKKLLVFESGDVIGSNGVFNDDYFVLRLYSLKPKNVEVVFRRLIASIDTESM